jgi:hypothetical protein
MHRTLRGAANSLRKYSTGSNNSSKTSFGVLAATAIVGGLGVYVYTFEDPRKDNWSEKRMEDLRANSDDEALSKLDRYGACILNHRRIPKATIQQWHIIVKEEFAAEDVNQPWASHRFRPVFKNRYHRNVLLLEQLQAKFMPTVDETLKPVSDAYFEKGNLVGKRALTEMQMLVSLPDSVNQFWHRDNTRPGISFTIPLHDTSLELGPTQIITATHKKSPESKKVISANLEAGEVLAYDARLIHRGTKNQTMDENRMAIAFRYDLTKTPPPGTTIVGTSITRVNGIITFAYCRLKDTLFG